MSASSSTSDIFFISAATVSKVLLVATVGLVLATQMSGGAKSVKGLSFYVGYIQLPCLLLTQLVQDLTWELLRQCWAALLFSCVALGVGYTSGLVVRRLVPEEARGHVVLGCTFQNAVSFALAMLYSVRGVSWMEGKALQEGTAYIFIYNIPTNFAIWGLGSIVVRNAVEEIAVKKGKKVKPKGTWFEEVWYPLLTTPPVTVTLIAAFVALVPPVKWLVTSTPPLSLILGGVKVLSEGCVPLQLLVLGCNLMSAPPPPAQAPEPKLTLPIPSNEAKEPMTSPASPIPASSPFSTVLSLEGGQFPPPQHNRPPSSPRRLSSPAVGSPTSDAVAVASSRRLGLIVTAVRLLVIPLVVLCLFQVLDTVGLMPTSKVFRFVMLLESCAPSGINVSILCTVYDYNPRRYAQMLVVCYIAAVFTTTAWMTLYLWLV
jgi:predicted permease